VAASVIGSIVGLGGGFLTVPVLRIAFGFSPSLAAGASLVLVLANACGATASYYRQRRIDLRTGVVLGVGAIPGSIAGALAVRDFASSLFDYLYAGFLFLIAADIVRRQLVGGRSGEVAAALTPPISAPYLLVAGLAVGLVSSFFGIGGGVIVVPLLLLFSRLPPGVIAGTSSFVILLSAPAGVLTHGWNGHIHLAQAVPLAAGGLIGGQIGAGLARRFSSEKLLGLLAVTLAVAAFALLLRHLL